MVLAIQTLSNSTVFHIEIKIFYDVKTQYLTHFHAKTLTKHFANKKSCIVHHKQALHTFFIIIVYICHDGRFQVALLYILRFSIVYLHIFK